MKKILTAACILVRASMPALAAAPTAESLDALFEVTRASALVDSLSATIDQNMRASMEQSIAGQKLTDAQRKVLDNMTQKSLQIVREEITWAKLKPLYVGIYQQSLTQEDIDG